MSSDEESSGGIVSHSGSSHSPDGSETPSSSIRSREMATALSLIASRIHWETKEKAKQEHHYGFPFIVDEMVLRKLHDRANESLRLHQALIRNEPTFVAEVRFPDGSTIRYHSLQELVERAGDKLDPERLTVEWCLIVTEPIGSSATIEAVFTTEKPLASDERQWFSTPLASMQLGISGPESRWVENVFSDLNPVFLSCRLGGIFWPLLAFRSQVFVQFFSLATAIMAQAFYYNVLKNMAKPDREMSKKHFLDSILHQGTAEKKIDVIATTLYGPAQDTPFAKDIAVMLGGFGSFVVVMLLGFVVFPRLVPRSGINIGLASRRYATYDNTFRLIIFTVILSGILLPLLRALLF